jgi:putative flippase GtrA
VTVTDEFAAVVAPKPASRPRFTPDAEGTTVQRVLEFVTHPENHKQAFRFLCVGGSGYLATVLSDWVLVHALSVNDTLAFWMGSLLGMANNFWWNRSWTFDAAHHHIGKQGVRYLIVAGLVAVSAFGVHELLETAIGADAVVATGIAYIIVTPLSFMAQKLWSFKS